MALKSAMDHWCSRLMENIFICTFQTGLPMAHFTPQRLLTCQLLARWLPPCSTLLSDHPVNTPFPSRSSIKAHGACNQESAEPLLTSIQALSIRVTSTFTTTLLSNA